MTEEDKIDNNPVVTYMFNEIAMRIQSGLIIAPNDSTDQSARISRCICDCPSKIHFFKRPKTIIF